MDTRTSEALIALKTEGFRSIYYLEVEGLELLFRPLTFIENETINDLERYMDGASINDAIVKMVTMYSSAPNGIAQWVSECSKAFVIDHIAQMVLDVSGYQSKDRFIEILNEKRSKAHEIQSLIEIYICTAFKNITIAEIRNMTLEDQLEFFAKAEEAIGKPIDFEAIFNPKPNRLNKNKLYPPKPGMQSSIDDLLNPTLADKPDFNERIA